MPIAKQLYQLQDLDLALESNEQAQRRIAAQLCESQELLQARAKLAAAQKKLEELNKQQKSTDYDIEDLTVKIKSMEKKLYDGKTVNPKELSAMQKDAEDLKKRRSQFEDTSLRLMDDIELTGKAVDDSTLGLKNAEAKWQAQQKQLKIDLEQLKTDRTALEARRQTLLSEIDAGSVDVYNDMRKRRGTAVARVEQGICMGCRIALPNSCLQDVRSGGMVKCSSCGRILYLA